MKITHVRIVIFECFILRAVRLFNRLLRQGYVHVKERLRLSLRKFYVRYGDLVKQYEVPISRTLHDILDDDNRQWHPPLIGHYTNFWPPFTDLDLITEFDFLPNTEDSNHCCVNAHACVRALANCSPLLWRHHFPGQKSCPDREQWFR